MYVFYYSILYGCVCVAVTMFKWEVTWTQGGEGHWREFWGWGAESEARAYGAALARRRDCYYIGVRSVGALNGQERAAAGGA